MRTLSRRPYNITTALMAEIIEESQIDAWASLSVETCSKASGKHAQPPRNERCKEQLLVSLSAAYRRNVEANLVESVADFMDTAGQSGSGSKAPQETHNTANWPHHNAVVQCSATCRAAGATRA